MASTDKSGIKAVVVALLSFIVMLHALGITVTTLAIALPTFYKRFWTYYPEALAETAHESIQFTTADGYEIPGLYFRKERSRKAVLMCHGRSRKKTHAMPYVQALMDDYNVLTFDFRGHGDNPFGTTSIGYHEAQDVIGALEWLEKEGIREVAIVGHSMGTAASLRAVAEYRESKLRISAMVLEGAFYSLEDMLRRKVGRFYLPVTVWWPAFRIAERLARYSISVNVPGEWISRVTCPVLLLQAKGDTMIPAASAERMHDAAEKGQVLYFKGVHDEPCEAVVRMCRAFVRKHL